ncbi:MAG: hypothetical protein IJM71_07760 [Clostridia bacterium]|nr:hypothetical protein [Clostridia bacterium]
MLKKTFVSSLYVIPATAAVLFFATNIWIPWYLITPPRSFGFIDMTEFTLAALMMILFSFLIPNKYEIELGLVNGCGTLKLALSKAFPVFVYSASTAMVFVAIYRYAPFDVEGVKTFLPITVPDDFRLYVFISVLVTALFFASLFFFMRVLLRNCYLPIFVDLTFLALMIFNSGSIKKGARDLRTCLFDPFITTYFVGNSLPNDISAQVERYSVIKNAWTYNRLIFLSFSLVLLAATLFLLRREKLHRGMGE